MSVPSFRCLCCGLFLILPLATRAQVGTQFDRLEVGQRVYEGVRITKVSPSTVTFIHSGGLAQVKLADLPPELQSHFGYDRDVAAAYQATRAEQRKQQNEAIRSCGSTSG